ncbi:hypothetical protein ACFL2A_00355, partial [Thermodesulfobacteriota bacterium]
FSAKEESSIIYLVDLKKPTIIVDIDDTISHTDRDDVVFGEVDEDSKPFEYSAKALHNLTEYFNIIIVTGREDAFLQKTRAWLTIHGFPRLPVFYADFGQTALIDQGEYKETAVKNVTNDINNVIAGVGDRTHDAKAYIKSGLKAIIIKEKGDVFEGAIRKAHWKDVEKELMSYLEE